MFNSLQRSSGVGRTRAAGFLAVLCFLASIEPLLAWGPEGHRAIGILAEQLISSEVRAKIAPLLAEGGAGDLAAISTWADDVREASRNRGALAGDPEAARFNREFPKNYLWHFVDLPLGTKSYRAAPPFISSEDVVQTIERCIKVLESPEALPGEFSQAEALRLLVHFVGDIHQPLHCVSGYYILGQTHAPTLVSDPAQAVGLPSDRGGNELFFDPQHELHAFWDSTVVESIGGTRSPADLARILSEQSTGAPVAETGGDYHRWPEEWALDSVAAARQAYAGIVFRAGQIDDDQQSVRLWIRLPNDYLIRSRAIAADQLCKAAVRLAQLLSRIQFTTR